ncbi:MAG: Ig-like domain-containing protein [Gammaproteobacteria bacterium]|nr:Ig-like domain-containing protein [Gammaproteobacteria bacterium]MDH5800430.1 Ig-like domain-containing protein [Gammaproteobacteria bacterium]
MVSLLLILSACGGSDDKSPNPQSLTAHNLGGLSVNEDESLLITLTGTDPDDLPLTFAVTTDVKNGSLLCDVAGACTYTPNDNYYGPDAFTFTASNGSETSQTAMVSITVNPVNDIPTAGAGTDQALIGGETFVLDGSASYDVDNDSLSYDWLQIGGAPVVLQDENTAAPRFLVPNSNDTLVFRLIVNDGISDSLPATVTLSSNAYTGTTNRRLVENPFWVSDKSCSFSSGVVVSGNYAYLVCNTINTTGLYIFDISNPVGPRAVGFYNTPGGANRVAVVGSYAYVADTGAGLQIIDVSDPALPTLTGSYDTPGSAVSVSIAGDYAYVADGSSGLQIINISTPATPSLAGSVDTTGHAYDVTVSGNYAYLADGSVSLVVVSVADPTAPVIQGSYNTSGTATGIAVAGNHAYVASASGLVVVNVSNPTVPTHTRTFTAAGDLNDLTLVDDKAYAVSFNRLQIIDLTDPGNPVLQGSYDTGSFSRDVAVAGNRAYVTTGPYGGLRIIDITEPDLPSYVGQYTQVQNATDVVVTDSLAYLSGGDSGLHLVDISNPSIPQWAGNHTVSGYAWGVAHASQHAYVTDGYGLKVVDVSDANLPTEAGLYNSLGFATRVTLAGNHAYMVDGIYTGELADGLHMIDISNPNSPQLTASYRVAGYATDVAVQGEYAYLAVSNYDRGVHIINVADPQNPSFVAKIATTATGLVRGVAVSGSHVYVADGSSGLLVVDVSTPETPNTLSTFDTTGSAYGVTVQYGEVYLATSGAVFSFDVTDPTLPSLIGAYGVVCTARSVSLTNEHAYAACDTGGLQVLPRKATLSQSYTTASAGGQSLTYLVTWPEATVAQEQRVKCWVTGGSCSVGAVDNMLNLTAVTWIPPTSAGHHEIRVAVGNEHYFITQRDRVMFE